MGGKSVYHISSTVKIIKIRTPEIIAVVIIIKFEQCDFTIHTYVQKMQTELQTV